jgi:iron complex transport system substrate-binding protein
MQNLKAIKTGRAHGIWHSYYNSPFNIIAVVSFAKWVHPDLFRDVSPEALMEEIYQRFLPFKLPGVYTVTLKAAE